LKLYNAVSNLIFHSWNFNRSSKQSYVHHCFRSSTSRIGEFPPYVSQPSKTIEKQIPKIFYRAAGTSRQYWPSGGLRFFTQNQMQLIWSPLLLYDNKSSTSNTKVRGLLRVSTSCAHVGSCRRSTAIGNSISDIAIARGVHRCVGTDRFGVSGLFCCVGYLLLASSSCCLDSYVDCSPPVARLSFHLDELCSGWLCKISRQHQMHTPTRVLTGFHHSNAHSLSQDSTGYSKRRVCVSESDKLKHLIVNRAKAEGTKWICQFSRQHQIHTPTRILA
jgi:hypothetical protein